MRIKLLADYRGVLTGERFFKAGEHDLSEETAVALVNAGRATVMEPTPEPETKPTTRTRKGKR